jgi:hypothetical protein
MPEIFRDGSPEDLGREWCSKKQAQGAISLAPVNPPTLILEGGEAYHR